MENIENNENISTEEIFSDIKRDYPDVVRLCMEDEDQKIFRIYAADDVLWKIFEDWMELVSSIEFNASTADEEHYLRVIP